MFKEVSIARENGWLPFHRTVRKMRETTTPEFLNTSVTVGPYPADEQQVVASTSSAFVGPVAAEPIAIETDERIDSLESLLEREKAQPTQTELLPVNRSHVWGVDFDCVTMEEAVQWIDLVIQHRATTYAITANLNYLMLCDRYPRLKAFTNRCPLVLCDGKPIQWRSMLGRNKLPERVAGADLIFQLAELASKRKYGIYLLGGAPGVAAQTAEALTRMYPGLHISGAHCPPFSKWTAEERDEMRRRITSSSPDILLVAFGQPKGEFWIEENYRELNVPISIQVGASFDFVTGTAKRAPKLLQSIGLEWFYRMVHDPKRLVPRYFGNAVFLLKAIRRELLRKLS